MPKIKIENIPPQNRQRVCRKNMRCVGCSFQEKIGEEDWICIFDDYVENDKIINMNECDFPTNREWLESLSNEYLAQCLRAFKFNNKHPKAIEEWLSKPCKYLMEEEQ